MLTRFADKTRHNFRLTQSSKSPLSPGQDKHGAPPLLTSFCNYVLLLQQKMQIVLVVVQNNAILKPGGIKIDYVILLYTSTIHIYMLCTIYIYNCALVWFLLMWRIYCYKWSIDFILNIIWLYLSILILQCVTLWESRSRVTWCKLVE